MHATAKLTSPSLLLQRGIICNSWHSTRRTCDCPTRTFCRTLMRMLMLSTACVLVMPLMCTERSVIQHCTTLFGSRSDLLRLETIIQRHALHNTEQPAQHALRCGPCAKSDAACTGSQPTTLTPTCGIAAVLMCLAGRRLLLAYIQRFPATQLCHFPAGVQMWLLAFSETHDGVHDCCIKSHVNVLHRDVLH